MLLKLLKVPKQQMALTAFSNKQSNKQGFNNIPRTNLSKSLLTSHNHTNLEPRVLTKYGQRIPRNDNKSYLSPCKNLRTHRVRY